MAIYPLYPSASFSATTRENAVLWQMTSGTAPASFNVSKTGFRTHNRPSNQRFCLLSNITQEIEKRLTLAAIEFAKDEPRTVTALIHDDFHILREDGVPITDQFLRRMEAHCFSKTGFTCTWAEKPCAPKEADLKFFAEMDKRREQQCQTLGSILRPVRNSDPDDTKSPMAVLGVRAKWDGRGRQRTKDWLDQTRILAIGQIVRMYLPKAGNMLVQKWSVNMNEYILSFPEIEVTALAQQLFVEEVLIPACEGNPLLNINSTHMVIREAQSPFSWERSEGICWDPVAWNEAKDEEEGVEDVVSQLHLTLHDVRKQFELWGEDICAPGERLTPWEKKFMLENFKALQDTTGFPALKNVSYDRIHTGCVTAELKEPHISHCGEEIVSVEIDLIGDGVLGSFKQEDGTTVGGEQTRGEKRRRKKQKEQPKTLTVCRFESIMVEVMDRHTDMGYAEYLQRQLGDQIVLVSENEGYWFDERTAIWARKCRMDSIKHYQGPI